MRILLSIIITTVFYFPIFADSLISPKYFGLGETVLGAIIDNKVHLYDISEKYKEIPDSLFSLPKGYKAVFGLGETMLGLLLMIKCTFMISQKSTRKYLIHYLVYQKAIRPFSD